jgi:hypothetical protein
MRGICGLHAYHSDLSLEENTSHHAFVLMAQQMLVEERYAPNVMRGSSPGDARMTGGSTRRLNKRAALPVFGLLIAARSTGERASDGFAWPEAVKPCAAIRIPLSLAMQVTHAKGGVRTIEVRPEIMPRPFQAIPLSNVLISTKHAIGFLL